jgi:hypothetical protein
MVSQRKTAYAQVQVQIEELLNSIASVNGFQLSSRNPNFGKGSSVTWSRDQRWRKDELRLLFLWAGRVHRRGVYADLGTSIALPDRSVAVDGYPTAWIARKSQDELTIRETHERAPADVVDTLRSDVVSSIAWLDRTYATPASALLRLRAADRNGVAVGKALHQAVVSHLERLAVQGQC